MVPLEAACCEIGECAGQDCLQLTERESTVCMTVCDSSAPLSFSAIRERLGLHQEVLSRIIRRLLIHGAVEKVDGKYRRKLVNKNLARE